MTEVISKQFSCHTACFTCSPARMKWSQSDGKKKEEDVGLPLLWISFPLDHPTCLEERVIVREKIRSGYKIPSSAEAAHAASLCGNKSHGRVRY